MKYITSHGISESDFKKKPFEFYDSINMVLIDLKNNSEKLYVLEAEENISGIKKFIFNRGFSRDKAFKNYYMDSEKRLIKLNRIVPITELLKNEMASIDYFFQYVVSNANELQAHSKNTLASIILFLIDKKIEPDLFINMCVKLGHLPESCKEESENYIINNNCNTEMLIEFANKVENCNINLIVKSIADNDTSTHCLKLLKALSKITNKNLKLDYVEDVIIDRDTNGNLILELANHYNDICNVDKLAKALDLVDPTGYKTYLFAKNIKGANKNFLQNSIAKKDKKGTYCIGLASEEGYDNEFLLDRIIELDNNDGATVIEFVKKATNCNLEKALDYLLDYDNTGKHLLEFAVKTNGYNNSKICSKLDMIDEEGRLLFLLALTIPTTDLAIVKNKIQSTNKPELFCNLFISNLTSNKQDLFFKQINDLDETGEIIEIICLNKSKKLSEPQLSILKNILETKRTN